MRSLKEIEEELHEVARKLGPGSRAQTAVMDAKKNVHRANNIITHAHPLKYNGHDSENCAVCDFRVVTIDGVKVHDPIRWGHTIEDLPGYNDGRRCYEDQDAAPEDTPIDSDGSVDFMCEECGKVAKSNAGLVAHVRAKHHE